MSGADVAYVGAVTFDEIHSSEGAVEGVMGGSGAYGALGAALLARAAIVSVVGDDFDEALLEPLRERGVILDAIERAPGPTFRWGCRYNESGNAREHLYTRAGVYGTHVATIPAHLRDARCAALTAGNALQNHACAAQLADAALVALDTIEREIREEHDAFVRQLPLADIVIINDAEAASLIGWSGSPQDDALTRAAADWIRPHGPGRFILKRGSRGADVCDSDGAMTRVCAVPGIHAADPTGAGDVFVGAVLSALARGDELVGAARWGCAAASFAVERFGLDGILAATRAAAEARLASVRARPLDAGSG